MSRRVDSVHRYETEQEQHMGGTYIRAPTVNLVSHVLLVCWLEVFRIYSINFLNETLRLSCSYAELIFVSAFIAKILS